MAESTLSLKLLVDTQGKRVLFAEAGKDFVDFLFHALSLPVGTVISLLTKQPMLGSLANLFQSIENLNDSYIQPNQTKNTLLNPVLPVTGYVPVLALNDAPTTERNFIAPPAVEQGSSEGGFVKGMVTYMVMDDLGVMPLSTISSITLLNKFNVKDLNALEEKVVKFGKNEAVKLLNASLQSKQVLTDVFLKVKDEPYP
ncbi:hypothetical protein DH2020_028137 [Rehmannia glutinosa]|uniref:DUF674 family protein n=1 Tax=Rehmannia glutinosa TaxID=99300 RepID=A0ABR0VUZ5_REHGL